MTAARATPDFSALHAAMQRWIDKDFLAGISVAVLTGPGEVHMHCAGFADREKGVPLGEGHLFRAFSNTKLVTSCAVLLLYEEGRFGLDDPIDRFLPPLANRRVLNKDAKSIDDTAPARSPITIGQLLTHTSGLSYGVFDPGSLLFKAYSDAKVLSPDFTIAQMVEALGPLPLSFEPGESWEYSVATDVLGRLVEVVSGQSLDAFFRERILQPLGMSDTGFFVPESEHDRLAAFYIGVEPFDPSKPGLKRAEKMLTPGLNLRPMPQQSGGGGLVTSLPDWAKLLRALMPGGPTLLQPATLELLAVNQLPKGRYIRFPALGELTGKGFGLGGGVVTEPRPAEHPESRGEIFWSGMAGTQWWISPRHGFSAALMTQRYLGFADPFVTDLKREVYRAVLAR